MPRRRDSRCRNVYAVAGLPLRGARGWGEELRAHAFTESVRDSRGRGILLIGSSGNEVSHNSASGSARAAIGLVASDDNLVDANSTSRNHVGLYAAESARNQVSGNSSASSGEVGIETDGVTETTFNDNRIAHGWGGMVLIGDRNSVMRNQLADIALHCDADRCPMALSVEGGSNNVVAENTIAGGYIGLKLDDFVPPVSGTIFRDNVVRGAATDGIGIGTEQVGQSTTRSSTAT